MPVRLTAILILVLVLAAILAGWHWRTSARAPDENPTHPTTRSSPEVSRKNVPVSPKNPSAKSHQRPDPFPATLSQMLQLLERKLPGEFVLPAESLAERIDRLNRIFADAGIPSSELIVVASQSLLDESEKRTGKFEEFRIVDPTGFQLLQWTAGKTRVSFKPLPGRIEFILATDFVSPTVPERPLPPDEDPFVGPSERTEPRPPRAPGDPFGP